MSPSEYDRLRNQPEYDLKTDIQAIYQLINKVADQAKTIARLELELQKYGHWNTPDIRALVAKSVEKARALHDNSQRPTRRKRRKKP